ncbi:conserved hypothetical protein [Neospora caninum Liverpool]|uniref:Uncharacterized protein n=1 Tax=Neospora caninum (strain Liverpool) TaxID=572307 RepID=F0VJG2_NEOCL|nr:conserved hypothetical protein [Neospora caninum Liverpool]CBZ53873.1 conserved hypothetical protein [Neospora caninum Liverpool]CEL67868.1 TPA: hypothetical protein BN1204_036550 [Neospora caninum Liverpool]|eukprot:XP_003883905.1 conserved hypothetical protein [Neospora caninum Liverpool]
MPSRQTVPVRSAVLQSERSGRDGAVMPRQGLATSVKSEVTCDSANEQSGRAPCPRGDYGERISAQILHAIEQISERSLSGSLVSNYALHRNALEETAEKLDELTNPATRHPATTRPAAASRSSAAAVRTVPSSTFPSFQPRRSAASRPRSEERPPAGNSGGSDREEGAMTRTHHREASSGESRNLPVPRTSDDVELVSSGDRLDNAATRNDARTDDATASRGARHSSREAPSRSADRGNRKKTTDSSRPGEPVPQVDAAAQPPAPKARDSRSRRPASTALADDSRRSRESGPLKRLRGPNGRFLKRPPGGRSAALRTRVRGDSASGKLTPSRPAHPAGSAASTEGEPRASAAPAGADRAPPKPAGVDGKTGRRAASSARSETSDTPVVETTTLDSTGSAGVRAGSSRALQGFDSTRSTADPRVRSSRATESAPVSDEVSVQPAAEENPGPAEAARIVEAICRAVCALQDLRADPSETSGQPEGGGGFWGCLCVGWGTPPPSVSPGFMTQAQCSSRFQWNIGRAPSASGPSTGVPPTAGEPSVALSSSLTPSSCSSATDVTPFDSTAAPTVGDFERACSTSSSVGDVSPSRRASVEPASCSDQTRPQEDTIRELEQWLRLLRAPLLPVAEK